MNTQNTFQKQELASAECRRRPISHLTPATSALLAAVCLFGTLVISDAKGKPAGDAPIQVTFDADNASDPLVPNGVCTDGGTLVKDGVDGTYAIVGRNRNIYVDLSSGSRELEIDFSQPVTPSTGIRIPDSVTPPFPYIQCNSNELGDGFSTALIGGSWSFSNTIFRVFGDDMIKLKVGASSPVNTDLDFYDANGNRWHLRWGPFEHSGSSISYNPGSDPVTVTRVDADTWDFTTTGQHHAALYRYESPAQTNSQHYYGQFVVPFSGTAVTLSSQSAPNPGVSAIPVILTLPEIAIDTPSGDQTLPGAPADVDFAASALDHCLDVSEEIIWTVNGNVEGTGATFMATFTADGVYSVTATAFNRRGASASDTVQITIGSPPAAVMSVDSITHQLRKGGKELRIFVAIIDGSAAPVTGADVTIEITGASSISPAPVATDSSGIATFVLGNVSSGNYTVTVKDVQHPDFDWDGVAASYDFMR